MEETVSRWIVVRRKNLCMVRSHAEDCSTFSIHSYRNVVGEQRHPGMISYVKGMIRIPVLFESDR